MTNKDKAREYLLKEHISPLNNIFHQCDLNTELQYHKDIENAFIKGAEWKDEQALRAFCEFACPGDCCLGDRSEKPCESYKLFKKILKGENVCTE